MNKGAPITGSERRGRVLGQARGVDRFMKVLCDAAASTIAEKNSRRGDSSAYPNT
jgi:hypothetical protein